MEKIFRECTFGEALFILLGNNDDSFEKDFQIPENELKEFLNKVKKNSKEIISKNIMAFDLEISDNILTDYENAPFDGNWFEIFIENMDSIIKFHLCYEETDDYVIDIIETPNKSFAFKGWF